MTEIIYKIGVTVRYKMNILNLKCAYEHDTFEHRISCQFFNILLSRSKRACKAATLLSRQRSHLPPSSTSVPPATGRLGRRSCHRLSSPPTLPPFPRRLTCPHDLLPSRHPTCPRTAQAPARPRPAGEEIDRRGGRRRGYQRRRHSDCRPSSPVSDTLKPHATSEQRAPTASSNLRHWLLEGKRVVCYPFSITLPS
jgi:hypothetical protein